MSSPDEVLAELESARELREREIRLLLNLIANETEQANVETLRRSLVLVTYAHLEGFCRVSMETYAAAINSLRLPCHQAVAPLVAATLHKVFMALRNVQSKHPKFAHFVDDSALHMTWREQKFVEESSNLMSSIVEIPDEVISMQANLNPSVLKRNMYVLGLSFNAVDAEAGRLSELLGRRNEITHGELVIPDGTIVQRYVESAFRTMMFVQLEIYYALRDKNYLKAGPPIAAGGGVP